MFLFTSEHVEALALAAASVEAGLCVSGPGNTHTVGLPSSHVWEGQGGKVTRSPRSFHRLLHHPLWVLYLIIIIIQ